jgi:hypothetical protein
MLPHHTTKPGWEYPWRELDADQPWTMRRYTMLVKDHKQTGIPDYLVVRDEIDAPEPVWWNLHVLGRSFRQSAAPDGHAVFTFEGQLDVDLAVHVIAPTVAEVQDRQWGWGGSKTAARRTTKLDDYEKQFFGAWIPRDFERGTWTGGEMAKWLRLRSGTDKGRTEWLVVLMPCRKGDRPATVEKLSETRFRVKRGDFAETISIDSAARRQVQIDRQYRTPGRPGLQKQTHDLLGAERIPPWAHCPWTPVAPDIDQGAL